MKFFIVFSLLFSVSHGYSQSAETEAASSENISSKETLTLLRNQIKRYVQTLMQMLLDEDTPRENQMEILEEIRSIADINGEITVALDQIAQSDIGQNKINISKGIGKDEDISVWAKSQAERVRRRQLALDELERRETELDKDFWVNLTLDGVVIVAGGVLFFIPAVGPAVSIPLTAGRITITGQRLGALLMATGGLRSGLDVWSYFFGEEKTVPSFVSSIAFTNVLTKEIFNIFSSSKPSERYLGIILLKSAVDEKTLINSLLLAIQDEKYSAEVRQSAIRALKAISNMEEDLREKVIDVLKGVVNESQIPSLRETSVLALGEIGKEMSEVAEYLFNIGDDTNNRDELRLVALIELGRNEDYFSVSIEMLSKWLKGRNYEKNPLRIQPEIPDSFRDSLLSERSKNHTIVLKEFIRSETLGIELKIKFSETLLSWDDRPENKELLSEVYSNPAKDIKRYVENDLFGGDLFEESYGAFQFLTNQISNLENAQNVENVENAQNVQDVENAQNVQDVENAQNAENIENAQDVQYTEIILQKIESIIEELEFLYPNQMEIAEKLEKVVNSYKKILKATEN